MPEVGRETEALREEIRTAFAWRPYPGDGHLALEPGCPGDESEDVLRFFRGRDWREVTLTSILDGREVQPNSFLFFMSAEGFVYFLPAFLLAALEQDDRFDLGEPLAFRLTPGQGDQDLFPKIVPALTPEEKRAVTHVLEHLAREYDERGYDLNLAKAALDSYWAEPVGSR